MHPEYQFQNLPVSVEFTLYKHNHVDNLLISYIKSYCRIYYIDGNMVITKDDMRKVLDDWFMDDVNAMKMMKGDDLFRCVNSAYFIDQIVDRFTNLRYLKISVSTKKNYTRLTNNGAGNVVNFAYRVSSAIINYSSYFSNSSKEKLKEFLVDIGVIESDNFDMEPYYTFSVRPLMDKVLSFDEESDEYGKYQSLIEYTMESIDPKLEEDDPVLIILT